MDEEQARIEAQRSFQEMLDAVGRERQKLEAVLKQVEDDRYRERNLETEHRKKAREEKSMADAFNQRVRVYDLVIVRLKELLK